MKETGSETSERAKLLRKGLAVVLVVAVAAVFYLNGEAFSDADTWRVRIPSLVLAGGIAGLVLAWGLWRWPERWW